MPPDVTPAPEVAKSSPAEGVGVPSMAHKKGGLRKGAGRPTEAERKRRKMLATIQSFRDELPELLCSVIAMIKDPKTSPAVRVQLITSLEKLTTLVPEATKPQEPESGLSREEVDQVVQTLLAAGAGRVQPIDAPYIETERVGMEEVARTEEALLSEATARFEAARKARHELSELRPLPTAEPLSILDQARAIVGAGWDIPINLRNRLSAQDIQTLEKEFERPLSQSIHDPDAVWNRQPHPKRVF